MIGCIYRKWLVHSEWRQEQLIALEPWTNYFRQLVHRQGKPSEQAAKTILSLLKKTTTTHDNTE